LGIFGSVTSITDLETGKTEWYFSLGFGEVYGVQLSGGKANIESFEEYEGAFWQIGGTCGVAGDTTIAPAPWKTLDVKGGLAFAPPSPSLGVGITVSVNRILSTLKKLKFW